MKLNIGHSGAFQYRFEGAPVKVLGVGRGAHRRSEYKSSVLVAISPLYLFLLALLVGPEGFRDGLG
jgi:hypothetical protein